MQSDLVNGVVVSGYRVASGTTDNSPYPKGTIELQAPFFKALGLDLTPYFPGTLNISISPHTFMMRSPRYTFRDVRWIESYPAEDFSFSPCQIRFNGSIYESLIYYPHPETKIGHFQNDSLIEVIAPSIAGLKYGDRVDIAVNPAEVSLAE
jgi:CTP-dependent riboflavin kinase